MLQLPPSIECEESDRLLPTTPGKIITDESVCLSNLKSEAYRKISRRSAVHKASGQFSEEFSRSRVNPLEKESMANNCVGLA